MTSIGPRAAHDMVVTAMSAHGLTSTKAQINKQLLSKAV